MNRMLSLVALLCFALIAWNPADAAGDAVEIKVVVRWQTSNWGPLERELQIRVRGPVEIEQGERLKISYTIEVFETADRPEHLWTPGPGSGGYKVLWKKTYKFDLTDEEVRQAAGL